MGFQPNGTAVVDSRTGRAGTVIVPDEGQAMAYITFVEWGDTGEVEQCVPRYLRVVAEPSDAPQLIPDQDNGGHLIKEHYPVADILADDDEELS